MRLDIAESLRARWFIVYSLVFGGIITALFVFGLAFYVTVLYIA